MGEVFFLVTFSFSVSVFCFFLETNLFQAPSFSLLHSELLNGIQSREQLLQLLAETGAGKDLNKQRLELVRSVLIAANAQGLQAEGGSHSTWADEGAGLGRSANSQSQHPLQMAGSFCGLQMIKSG